MYFIISPAIGEIVHCSKADGLQQKTETVILGQDLGETRELVYHPNEGERVR